MVQVPGYVVFAAAIAATLFVLAAGRWLLKGLLRFIFRPIRRGVTLVARRLIRPVYRVTLRPVVGFVRRRLKVGAAPAKQGAGVGIGAARMKALLNLVEMSSLANAALGQVPAPIKALIERKGILFRRINANRAVEGLHESLSVEEAQANVELANKYYGRTIDKEDLSPAILYEDSEEALIIEILRDADISFFWVLRTFRRKIVRNIGYILGLMTVFVAALPFALEAAPTPLAKVAVFAGYICLVALFRLNLYSNAAWYNGNHMNLFVQTYFSRLLNQYKSAATAFSNILNDRTAKLDTVEKQSSVWFINLHWISARQWLLDLYVRNLMFQIGRDWLWKMMTVPPILLAILYCSVIVISHVMVHAFGMQVSATLSMNWTLWTMIGLGIAVVIYFAACSGLLRVCDEEIARQGWPSFYAMDIKQIIEKNIGPMARELVDKRRNPYGAQPGNPIPG